MKRLPLLLLASLLPLSLHAATPGPHQDAPAAAPSAHVALQPAQLQWGPIPPAFEPGAQLAVLSGDPGAEGIYVLRLKMPAGYAIALHWHPTDEHVTVIDGDLTLTMAPEGEAQSAHELTSGGYAQLPARMHHSARTRDGATVQVSGQGPFQITYVNDADDPRKRGASD